MNFEVLNDSNDIDPEADYPTIEELEQHIKSFRAMYRAEMRLARANSQYLLDGIAAAKAEIAVRRS